MSDELLLFCSVPGCQKTPDCRGWCRMHYTRWQRHGDPLVANHRPGWRGDDVSYRAAHKRIYRQLGKASERCCVDCGSQARDWTLAYERAQDVRRGVQVVDGVRYELLYSLNINDYDPRCKSCHLRQEYARRRAS